MGFQAYHFFVDLSCHVLGGFETLLHSGMFGMISVMDGVTVSNGLIDSR